MRSAALLVGSLLVGAQPSQATIQIGVVQLQSGIPHYSINVATYHLINVRVVAESAVDGMTGFAFSNPLPTSDSVVVMGRSISPCLGLDCDVGPGGFGDWLVGLGSCFVASADSYFTMVEYSFLFFAPMTVEICVAAPSYPVLNPSAPAYSTCAPSEILAFELAPRPEQIPSGCLQIHAGTVPTSQVSWSAVKGSW